MNCLRCASPMNFVAQYGRWWCERCKAYGDAPPPPPPAAPVDPQQAATARTLVMWSHILGWPFVGVLILGTPAAAKLGGGVAGATVAGISVLCIIVGAILGQVGRGMQGRVI